MGKYIAVDKINIEYMHGDFFYNDRVSKVPVVEAMPVYHAKWKIGGSQYKSCSHCGNFVELKAMGNQHWRYCPYCGARMDAQ